MVQPTNTPRNTKGITRGDDIDNAFNWEDMNEQLVTPEYLLGHGFYEYKSKEEGDCCDIPFSGNESIHFREITFHRQLFVVVFNPTMDDPPQYSPDVYVQDNVGCGFVEIPFPWWELTVEYFESVYYGIRGERPKETSGYVQDAEYEIIKPKELKE